MADGGLEAYTEIAQAVLGSFGGATLDESTVSELAKRMALEAQDGHVASGSGDPPEDA